MKKRILLVFPLMLLCSFSIAATQTFAQIAEFVEHSKQVFDMPSGTAIAVIKGDEIIYEGYFGYEDIAAQKKVSSDTMFYIASATKPFFALATLLKIHDGQLDETTSLQSLFPETEFRAFDAKAITVRDLLTHTSGIDNQAMLWATAYSGTHDLTIRNQLVEASSANDENSLGKFDYSNIGYNILSVWFDNTDQSVWQDNLHQTVLSPLKMAHTSAIMSDASRNEWPLAKPYLFSVQGRKTPVYLTKKDNTMHSAGGLISTASDLARFLIAQVNEGRVDGKHVFPKEVVKRSQVPQAQVNNTEARFPRQSYAWGWYVGDYMSERLYHHFGGFPGSAAHLSFMPDKQVGVVILNNEGRLHGSNTLSAIYAEGIYTLLLNQDKPEELVREQVSNLFTSKLKGLKAMVDRGSERELENNRARAEREWQLSLNRQAYVGTYKHELIGDIVVSQPSQKTLRLDWGNLSAVATAFKDPESIRVELVPGRGDVVAFSIKGDNVISLTLDGMTFNKSSSHTPD